MSNHIAFFHLGNKPFCCNPCGKNFKKEKDLNNHNSSVHEGKNYGNNFAKSNDHKISVHERKQPFNVVAINVFGIECNGLLEEIRLLLNKYKVDIAILSETETTHSLALTTNIEGFKVFCPPLSVTGPPGKEVVVLVMVSQDLAASCKVRPDINDIDTVQTVWLEISNHNILIGGVY